MVARGLRRDSLPPASGVPPLGAAPGRTWCGTCGARLPAERLADRPLCGTDGVDTLNGIQAKRWGQRVQFVVNDRDAELNAARQMRRLGFHDAEATRPGADGGIDVRASGAVAQVKCRSHPTGKEAVQRLYGARGKAHSLDMLFFSSSSYSGPAVECADDLGVCLFTYDVRGEIAPVNEAARQLVSRSQAKAQQQKPNAAAAAPFTAPQRDSVPRHTNTAGSPPRPRDSAGTQPGQVAEPRWDTARAPVAPAPSILQSLLPPDAALDSPENTHDAGRQADRDARKRSRASARRKEVVAEREVRPTVFEKLDQKASQLEGSSGGRSRDSVQERKKREKSPFRRFLGR
ncbi:restriction endonuclease [Rhodococcus sp. Br-6]|nr:restriction endonuclease [Rhodococcus sp. Br-6]